MELLLPDEPYVLFEPAASGWEHPPPRFRFRQPNLRKWDLFPFFVVPSVVPLAFPTRSASGSPVGKQPDSQAHGFHIGYWGPMARIKHVRPRTAEKGEN